MNNSNLTMSHNNNMDIVRYYLAISVLIAHFNSLLGYNLPWPTTSTSAVDGFFALSGFLVFGSYLRTKDAKHYLIRRAKRILPPYFFIVLLCAFGLSLISTESISNYFTSPQWWKYLIANISFLNFIEPNLPGVFTTHNVTAVNGSLWTMKIEWMLYFSVPIVYFIYNRFKWNKTATFIVIYVVSVIYCLVFLHLYEQTEREIYNILSHQVFGQLMYFYTGVIIYFHFNKFLQYKWYILSACIVLSLTSQYIYAYDYTVGPAVTSCLVLLACFIGKWGTFLSRIDNVSYDVYLYHIPVIQVASHFGITRYGLVTSFSIILLSTFCLAIISWNCIGKHFMKKR